MKSSFIRSVHFIIVSSALILTGCTRNYDEINTDPTRLTTLSTEDIKGLFTRAEYMAMYSGDGSAEYQYAQGFFADLYAQYSAITATFDPTDRYNISQEWIQEQWIGTFRAMAPLVNIIKQTEEPEKKALNAIARIWKVWTIHRATDYYGPFPYSYIGYDSTVIPYDKQEDIYMDLFKELKEATADLQANIDQASYGDADLIYHGDNSKWLKFANTLRLRLAMRVSNVEPELAKTEAEAAHAGGTMVDLSDDAYLESSGVNYNGYLRQSGWNEFRMSQTMESFLVGYNDPRLPKYWQPAVNTGEYKGVRNGMNVAAHAGGTMVDLSDDAYLESSGVNYNGYLRQSGWNEFRMSQTMESFLVGYNDPRLPKYWQPAVNTGEYKGVRNGMNVAEIVAPENEPDNTSGPSDYLLPENMSTTPSTVMYTAEAYFLRAEGALNGWEMGGTAQELYETGIEMSLRTWGVTDASVISNYINGTTPPMAPGGMFNTPAASDIPVKFSGVEEKQREQILTQKWLALFPEGHEAWAEVRRSGYPKLYPVLHNDNPAVGPGEFIRRIPFLNYDRDRNGPAVEAAVPLLGGPDNIGTPLWWDVD